MAGLSVSALTGEGLGTLREALAGWVRRRLASDGDEGGLVSTARQIQLLADAERGLRDGLEVIEGGAPIEIALVSLQTTLRRLAELLGIEVDDAVLDRIFSTFCVGK
jgi:tRNA modification GTPase